MKVLYGYWGHLKLAKVERAKDLMAKGEYKITVADAYLSGFVVDSKNPDSPFADVRVRQALEYAIDKQAICDTIGFGFWTPAYQAAAQGSWAYNPDVVGYPYNPTKAKQLLAEAGYPNGFKTTLGTHFDTYSVKSKEILGI